MADREFSGDDGAEAVSGDDRRLELEEVADALERVHVARDGDRCDRHLRAAEAREVGSEDASRGGEPRQCGEPRPPASAEPVHEQHGPSNCAAKRCDMHPAAIHRERVHSAGDGAPVGLVFATVVSDDLLVHCHEVEG